MKKRINPCGLLNKAHPELQRKDAVGNADLNTQLFNTYARNAKVSTQNVTDFWNATKSMPRDIMQSYPKQMASHKVNRGIMKAGALCFSYMRADIGLDFDGRPALFEINEFLSSRSSGFAHNIVTQAYQDLFQMIVLAGEAIIGSSKRRVFEQQNLSRWDLLYEYEEEEMAL